MFIMIKIIIKKNFKVFTKLIIQLHQFCTKNIVENLRCSKKHFKYIIFCFIKVFHVLIHQLKFMFFFIFQIKDFGRQQFVIILRHPKF